MATTIVDNNSALLLKAWGGQFSYWCKVAGWSQEYLAKKMRKTERTVWDWQAGRAVPHPETLAQLSVHLYDAKRTDSADLKFEAGQSAERTGYVWQYPGEVLDWFALLGLDQKGVLELKTNPDLKRWLKSAYATGLPWPTFPLPTMYVERELDQEIVKALTMQQGYQQPCYRVIVLHGPPGSGKSTLATAVMRQPSIRGHFRSGGQWVPETEFEWLLTNSHLLLMADKANNPGEHWWNWLSSKTTMGLVILDDLTQPRLLTELLNRAGSHVQFIITTQDPDKAQAGLGQLAVREVLYVPMGGLSMAQAECFLTRLWGRPLTEMDYKYLGWIISHINRPEPLRLLAAEVELRGWAEVWDWLWKGQDQDTPLGSHWQRLLERAWSRRDPTERTWLEQLAVAIQNGSTFGYFFATQVWAVKAEIAIERLALLERRGWLEQVDDITQANTPRLVTLLGSQRYRLLREGWTFIQKESTLKIGLKKRLAWASRLGWHWQRQLGVSWNQLGSSFLRRLLSSIQLKDNDELGLLFKGGHLEYWLTLNWIQRGVWPPEELWLIFQASRHSRWVLLPLLLLKVSTGILMLSAGRFLEYGGSILLKEMTHSITIDWPTALVTESVPVLTSPDQRQGQLLEQTSSGQNDTDV